MSNDDSGLNSSVADAAAGVENPTQEVNPQSGGDNGTPGINPAWEELLGSMPTSLHSQIIPHLQKWDSGVEKRFATVQSQYEPYKALIEQQVDPGEAVAALRMAQMIAENPRDFYDRLGQHYGSEWGIGSGQGQAPNDADDYSLGDYEEEEGEGEEGFDLSSNPLFKQLQEQQQTIAQFLAADLQRQQQAEEAKLNEEADREVATAITTITEKYGNGKPLNENFVKATLSMAVQNNQTIEEAAEVVAGLAGMNSRPAPPTIMSPSGGVPLTQVNPADLDSKATKNLVMEILKSRGVQG